MNQVFETFANDLKKTVDAFASATTKPYSENLTNKRIAGFLKEYVYPYLLGGPADNAYFKARENVTINGETFAVKPYLLAIRFRMRGMTLQALGDCVLAVRVCKKTHRIIPYFQLKHGSHWAYDASVSWQFAGMGSFMSASTRRGGRSFDTSVELYYLQLFMTAAYLSAIDPDWKELKGLLLALRFFDSGILSPHNRTVKDLAAIVAVCSDVRAQPELEKLLDSPPIEKILFMEIDTYTGCKYPAMLYVYKNHMNEKRPRLLKMGIHPLYDVTSTQAE